MKQKGNKIGTKSTIYNSDKITPFSYLHFPSFLSVDQQPPFHLKCPCEILANSINLYF